MIIKNTHEIFTERLVLKRFNECDLEKYYDILKQEEVSKWLGTGKRKSYDDVKNIMQSFEQHWSQNNYGVWAVINKENDELIGHCGLKNIDNSTDIELLYAFKQSSWGHGYATESAKSVIEFAKNELKLLKLVAIVYPNNIKSCNVIEKLGFEYRGIQKHFGVDLSYYELDLNK
ncbi:GNAT family N-acetyltransferase [Paraclostridium bifermentans]|uniref:GNAT family N-acetyltransferase n=1 Tax=Paraclostridium bifermentans TaxID=1490 RepID=UPI0018A9F827|nr:GNAT family N-acetyltransferase [Paraclostridium bifermentans]